jgi:hypothetical protein
VTDVSEVGGAKQGALGTVPTGFSTRGPKTIPRVDYERIFVVDASTNLLGEYVLNDESPLEFSDMKRSIPMNGMRHLVSFYQGEYAFTPFRVDDLWFVVLTRGIPRIDERGHTGTLLAAARIHIPPAIEPALARKEMELHTKEQELEQKEAELTQREQHVAQLDAELRVTSTQLQEFDVELRTRETKLKALRDYALQMERALQTKGKAEPEKPKDAGPAPDLTMTTA